MVGVKKKAKRRKKLRLLPLSGPVRPQDLVDRARQYGPACADVLADVAANGTDSARVSAANALLDRGYGKVRQGAELSGSLAAGEQGYRVPDNGRD
jgi:hypothetical protein